MSEASCAIEVADLRKRFDRTTALDGMTLQVRVGECVGLLGPNGAGKTTTIEILEGLQRPTSGSVRVLGTTWDEAPEKLRRRIGIQLQETRFTEEDTVEETVKLFRSFAGRGDVQGVLEQVQLTGRRTARVGHLSGGQRQRLALAVAMVGDPELLFLDEPTTGVDPQSRIAVWDAAKRLKSAGKTIVLTTHYMEEAELLSDRVIIVDHGRVLVEGTPAELIARYGGNHAVTVLVGERSIERLPELAKALGGDVVERSIKIRVKEVHTAVPEIVSTFQRHDVPIENLSVDRPSLDDVFLALTGRSVRESAT